MIIPHPESDMSLNLMVVSSDIVNVLKKKKDYMLMDNLFKDFLEKDSRRTVDMFFNAITYLFTLGIIEETNYKVRVVNAKA